MCGEYTSRRFACLVGGRNSWTTNDQSLPGEARMRRALHGFGVGLILFLLAASTVAAQVGSTAQITGTVKDESGGVLPGADVTAIQTDTGFRRPAVTDATGSYTLPNLPIGPYRLEVSLSGFRS